MAKLNALELKQQQAKAAAHKAEVLRKELI